VERRERREVGKGAKRIVWHYKNSMILIMRVEKVMNSYEST
jgi:hypothetical protein